MSNNVSWYAVVTRPRQEKLARMNLERQGYRVLFPSVRQRKRQRGKWRMVVEPMFPGYLFVSLTIGEDDLSPIRSTVGCVGLVKFGPRPQPVPSKVMLPLIDFGASPVEVKMQLEPGDLVRFEQGPLEGIEAVYNLPRGGDRVEVLLNLLGRQSSIEAHLGNISKI